MKITFSNFCVHLYLFPAMFFQNQWNFDKDKTYMKMEPKFFGIKAK